MLKKELIINIFVLLNARLLGVRVNKNNQIKESELVQEIIDDYNNRLNEKRAYEEAWLLNINFLIGNQYTFISPNGEIEETQKLYSYESREVFNHIAPIIESRLAKLGKVRPAIAVRPSSASEKDKETAKISKMVLDTKFNDLNISEILKTGTVWSEVTGTVIYKLTYDNLEKGKGVEISVVNPFEIFPENNSIEKIEDNPSIIHARCIDKSVAESVYGLSGLVGQDMMSLSLDGLSGVNGISLGGRRAFKSAQSLKHDQVLVIERYFKPSASYENGLLQVVVGSKLVYNGDLPLNEYPFVKQVSNSTIGNFWGTSVIERCIPLQRAYNAVKNRKLEYMSRLARGVLAVEEGSVDLDMLEDEGLAPGKILVYRSGTSSPRFMDGFTIPSELNREEDRLIAELNTLAGVSEFMRNSLLPSNVTSGTAINQLTEADDTRLSVPAEHIRECLLEISKLMLRVIKKYSQGKNLSKLFDDNGDVLVFSWKSSDLKAEDIVLDTVNELSDSLSSRRQSAIELFRAGLFSDENGKLDNYAKSKILDILGFGSFESGQDITRSHINRAKAENLDIENAMVLEVDDHDVHCQEHTRYIIENKEIKNETLNKMLEHIRVHKSFKKVGESLSLGGNYVNK